MRRFIFVLILLTVSVGVVTVRFLPERCELCDTQLFRISLLESLWHGHGDHLTCQDCFHNVYARRFDPAADEPL
jgi:hypothetical protein